MSLPISMKYADVRRELRRLRDERVALVGDDNFNYCPRGLERAYALPCDAGILAAYVYPEGPTITVYFWERGRTGMREITNVLANLSGDQLNALIRVKADVDLWVDGQIDALPPSTHGI